MVSKNTKQKLTSIVMQISREEIHINNNEWFGSLIDPVISAQNSLADKKTVLFFLLHELEKLPQAKFDQLECIGLIHFKIAGFSLGLGQSLHNVIDRLNKSFKDDLKWDERRRKLNPKHLIAIDMSAYRFMQVLKALDYYSRSDTELKNLIDSKDIRADVYSIFASEFNRTQIHPLLSSLSWKPFDQLLGRNQYRAQVQQNYEGALVLVRLTPNLHRKKDLAQYGVASAALALCGATIEGILSKNAAVKNDPKIKGRKNPTLGAYCRAYLRTSTSKDHISALLLFLLAVRNQIHPRNEKNKYILVDMLLARFVFRITERLIVELAKTSRNTRHYKWWEKNQ